MSLQEPLRILHLISSERWTGVAEPACGLAVMQQRAECEVWIAVIWGRSLEERAGLMGLRFARDLDLQRRINPLRLMQDISRLRQFIVENRIDIVHCHLLHDHWLAVHAVRKLTSHRPVVVRTVHRYEKMRSDPFHSWLFEKSTDLVITVSTEQKGLIDQAYHSLKHEVMVIPGAVDPVRFKPDEAGRLEVRNDMGERPQARVAGIVAHLGYRRGHDWLLRAAPKLVEAVPDATIWIVGQGEIKYRLRDQIRAP